MIVDTDQSMKTKMLLWNVVFLLVTALAAKSAEPLQTISLSDGSKATFLGITYGKHHEAPNYEAIGGNLKTGRWIDRSNDVAVAWMEFEQTNFPNYSLYVSDKADANGVGIEADSKAINLVRKGVQMEGFELQAYPRWDEQFFLSLTSYGHLLSSEKFLVTNPHRKEFGNAVAEKLPVSKTDGDLSVTLTNFVGGVPAPPYLRGERIYPLPGPLPDPPPSDPPINAVRFGFDLKQNGIITTNWQLASVAISDAVSNYVEANLHFQDNELAGKRYPFIKTPADDYRGYVFWPGLWPNEPAWNVRLEFTRVSDFNADEIVTFTNLPVRKATEQNYESEEFSIAQEHVQGVRLKIVAPVARSESQSDREYLSVFLFADPDPGTTLRLTVIQATDGKGHSLPIPNFPTLFLPDLAGRYFLTLSDLPDVKTLNLKLALHRSRYVTFTVKPDRL